MITYELMLLLRTMPKPELHGVLKRIATAIFDKGGVIRKLDNLGHKDMPYKTSSHGVVYNKASYFLYEFTVPPSSIDTLLDEYGRDVDIIRRRIYKKNEENKFKCTLDEELQPPPYRKEVQEMIAKARRLDKPKFSYNNGMDYYPFQK
ncbi:hypothetical protein NQ315_001298 [Exocentrus adspersus]|uniref:Small ribosomal subunit protein bS6m n=1 Tax=Exocentrus adspersus TaxID=1586481 RepID=A0AAV8WFV8_9CUCU|nr:hypothetical protein NQ315_001298 [Exocentrus adspersus]